MQGAEAITTWETHAQELEDDLADQQLDGVRARSPSPVGARGAERASSSTDPPIIAQMGARGLMDVINSAIQTHER
eukprot:5724273-Heterocapsa_arctica.AAC.1